VQLCSFVEGAVAFKTCSCEILQRVSMLAQNGVVVSVNDIIHLLTWKE
jgi:hypothetical protein